MPSGSFGRPSCAAEDADQVVDLVVVRRDVVVGDRPVVAEAVEALAAGSRRGRSGARCGPSDSCGRRACARATSRTACPARRCTARPRCPSRRSQASNSPNGRSVVEAPRRGESYGQVNIVESRGGVPRAARLEQHHVRRRPWSARWRPCRRRRRSRRCRRRTPSAGPGGSSAHHGCGEFGKLRASQRPASGTGGSSSKAIVAESAEPPLPCTYLTVMGWIPAASATIPVRSASECQPSLSTTTFPPISSTLPSSELRAIV